MLKCFLTVLLKRVPVACAIAPRDMSVAMMPEELLMVYTLYLYLAIKDVLGHLIMHPLLAHMEVQALYISMPV